MPRPAAMGAPADDEPGLSEAELDALVAPVALYPDSLLAQVLVAATYPLEVVKAGRWLTENAALGDKERVDAAQTQDWDPSVQVLAGAFPDVIRRMAEDIDGTEALGDAVLAQTDGVLDAVQRMRARAAAAGNLESNEAQVVETRDDMITIEPADPGVVYLPQYDPAAAFAPYPYPGPVTSGGSTGNLLVTGAIAFGSALLIDEIFDDDDDWDDYWHGPPAFDWDDDAFYPRGDVDIEGDVNIDRDINVDRDRVRIEDGERRIGDRDVSAPERRGAWEPSPERQDEARQKLAAREPAGGGARGPAQDKLKARADSGARGKLEAATAKRGPATMPSVADSVLRPGREGPARAHQASGRGAYSLDKNRPQAGARQASLDRPKSVSRPQQARSAAKRSPPKSTAFKRSSGGSRAKSASSRGRSSVSRSRGGGGRRR